MVDPLSDLRKLDLPFDVDKVDEQCHECVRAQLKKYDGFIDSEGRDCTGKFLVPCKGIPKDPSKNTELRKLFDNESWGEFLSSTSSVHFAAQKLKINNDPWIARWYQEKILRCSASRRVLRCARRSGKSDAISIDVVYRMFTQKGIKIVLIAPHKPQVEEIMNRVKGFIDSSSTLSECKVRDRAAPYYEIVISGGSRIRGFAVGSVGGSEGVSVRGQDADVILVEEMSYVDSKALKGAVMPILQTSPDTALIGFSTPTGAHDVFYEFCKQSPEYIEFHYNYKVLPWWKKVEADRHLYTEAEWTAEFLAEFFSQEDGVYKTSYVDQALKSYRYEEFVYNPRWRYVIGTDWNEVHGTEILTLGWNPAGGMFRVVDAICVEKSEYTQLSGVAKLIEMVKKWHPAFVYIDAGGGGSTNEEVLRKTSYSHRRPGGDPQIAKLLDILKKYDSGASVEARDPIDGRLKKRPAKQFMVNACVRLFEQGKMVISSADKTLEKQLRSYIIKRISPTGTPVYDVREAKVQDHRLDALHLAAVAYHLEFGDLHTVNLVTTALSAPGPRSNTINQRSTVSSQNRGIPEDRRLDLETDSLRAALGKLMLPGRIGIQKIKSTRPGWATDEEDKFLRRKTRREISHDRPRRTNF